MEVDRKQQTHKKVFIMISGGLVIPVPTYLDTEAAPFDSAEIASNATRVGNSCTKSSYVCVKHGTKQSDKECVRRTTRCRESLAESYLSIIRLFDSE